MYYIILFAVYLVPLLGLALYFFHLKKTESLEAEKAKDRLATEMLKGLSKSDLKSRKKRTKILPLSSRFLYWLWFSACISFMFTTPIALLISRHYVIKALCVPDNAFCFEANKVSLLVLVFCGILLGAVASVGFSYLTYSKTIEKADALYQMGSFQTYPKLFNVLLSFILILVFFPITVVSYNNYQYCTETAFVIKPVFAVTEKSHDYADIDYVEQKVYKSGNFDYIAHMKNGKKYKLYDSGSGSPELLAVFERYDLPVVTKTIVPPIDRLTGG